MVDPRRQLTEYALGLPGTREDYPWNELVIKVGTKVFVFLGGEEPWITVKLDESHGHALSIDGAHPTGYGLGRSGWVTVPVSDVPLSTLCEWVEESYRIVAPKRFVTELDADG